MEGIRKNFIKLVILEYCILFTNLDQFTNQIQKLSTFNFCIPDHICKNQLAAVYLVTSEHGKNVIEKGSQAHYQISTNSETVAPIQQISKKSIIELQEQVNNFTADEFGNL